jgi:hypothetical protein
LSFFENFILVMKNAAVPIFTQMKTATGTTVNNAMQQAISNSQLFA